MSTFLGAGDAGVSPTGVCRFQLFIRLGCKEEDVCEYMSCLGCEQDWYASDNDTTEYQGVVGYSTIGQFWERRL